LGEGLEVTERAIIKSANLRLISNQVAKKGPVGYPKIINIYCYKTIESGDGRVTVSSH
jgi:hypothetical protein